MTQYLINPPYGALIDGLQIAAYTTDMRYLICPLIAAAWLVSLATSAIAEPFCKTPNEREARHDIILPKLWGRGQFDVEVTVPQQLQTAHIASFISEIAVSHPTVEVRSNEFITFNGSDVLQKNVHPWYSDEENIYNITGNTCTTVVNMKALFASSLRFVPLVQIRRTLRSLGGTFSSEIVYVDNNSTVRDVTVSHWKFCHDERLLMHFFTDSGGNIMRITITGRNIPMIHYDILAVNRFYFNHQLKFPTGVVCKRAMYVNTHPPAEFESFSATVVMLYPSHNFSTITKEFYDNSIKLKSSLIFALPGTSIERRFGHGYLRIIRDDNTGLRYVMDPKRGNCTIDWTDMIWTTYLFNGPWDPTDTNHRQSPGLFDLHNFEFNFHETVRTMERGQQIKIFKAFKQDWPDYGINTTAELYYTTDRWVTGGAHPNDDAAPETNEYNEYVDRSKLFGFWFDTTSALRSSYLPGLIPKVTHVHEYKEGVDDFSVFDISACYVQPKQVERVVFSLPGCYCGIMRTRPKLLETALRQYIVRETGVDLIRVGEIERVSRVTLDEAVTRLKDAVDAVPARPLVVEYPEGDQRLIFIRGSLRFGGEAKLSITKGHSEGAMVAVAVTTVVLGLVLGLMVYMILWKKSQSPYLVE
ncbi:hypothetical protein LSAT2_015851 [Lamellibrachia satsuma]|nr:hypothetical protein LSAT2_015851 [Lamellibrachia satsuma]